ncbi:MAG: cysteine desulfurase family protein [Gemmatimonas sp.]
MPSRVYLDHNAGSPLRPDARDAITAALAIGANPSSVHAPGREARAAIEQARASVAALAGVSPESVVFTSGATEANNLALKGAPVARRLVSTIEHASVLEAAPDAERIPVDARGIVGIAALERMLAGSAPTLVSVMAANNETGVLQPIAEIARVVHAAGALLHCDAAQVPGRMALAPITAVADLVSLSSPKMGGPQGVGALIVREGVTVVPLIAGGGQERRLRAGTENLLGIAGFGAAARAVARDGTAAMRLAALHDRLEAEALAVAPEAIVIAADAPRLANTSALALPGIPAESQILSLDLAGIAIGAGAACSSGKIARSHVLAAMGIPDHIAAATIRVSLGPTTTDADVDAFLAAWADLRARARANRGDARREVA